MLLLITSGLFWFFSEDLQELITSANANNVTFVYALSPGLDITYSDDDDKNDLKCKLDQVNYVPGI